MTNVKYRRDKRLVEDLCVCTVHMHNGDEVGLSPRRLAILRTLNRRATPRQRQCLYLYYGRRMNQAAIGSLLGIDISTVSRNISHGERHVREMEAILPEEL